MAKLPKVARRAFLIGSAAVSGGVAFGIYRINAPLPNPLVRDLQDGESSFNPWVKVTSDKITLITPHVDLGQGAVHVQALLIAEEMDLNLKQFETTFGEPDAAYHNTALAADAMPLLASDQSAVATTSRDAVNSVAKLLGLQITGGSSSVADSFDKLRQAGAVARETLKAAAAQEFGLTSVAALRTEAGAVHLPDGSIVPYQALAETAAGIEPVLDVELRSPRAWRLIGKTTRRQDAEAKSYGTQNYGIDVQHDGMVYASVLLSPTRAAARTADLEEAKKTDGVLSVFPISIGFAVVAKNTWSAFQGALAIQVDWEPAPFPEEQEDHWAELSASFVPERLDRAWRSEGDVDSAQGTVVTAEYRAPYVAHQPLEPLNATILNNDGMVEIWVAHQMPRFAQKKVAKILGIPAGNVVFHNQFAGGSFGHRLEFDNIICAAEISRVVPGVPIKVTWSREQDFAGDYPRQIGMSRARGTVTNGPVNSIDLQMAGPSVTASQISRLGLPMVGPDLQLAAGAWNAPYAPEHFRVRAYRAENLAPVSSWRSVGASTCGFFLEGFLDELIHAAGADPIEERIRLCSWDVAKQTLEAVREMCDWGTRSPPGTGRGVAFVESFNVPVAMVVEVTSSDDGIILNNVWVAVDSGLVVDPDTFESQVQGGVIWGLGHAMNSELTFSGGRVEQSNYHDAEGLRLYQTPEIHVRALQSNPSVRGIGEPPVPPAAPALASAIFAATGVRIREMPFHKFVDFV